MITKRNPIFGKLPLMDNMMRVEGEVRMWRSFLDQMIIDSFGSKYNDESNLWLMDRDGYWYPDFYKVCEMAQLEPQWVEIVIERLERGEAPL